MKILQIADGYRKIGPDAVGSIERVIFEVSRNLVTLGHEVTILERKDNVTQDDTAVLSGVDVIRVGKKRASGADLFNLNSPTALLSLLIDGLTFSFSMHNYLKKSKKSFDIIHFHLPLSGIPFLLVTNSRWRSRIVYTYHGSAMRIGLSKYSKLPNLLRFFHPDIFMIKNASAVAVLNSELRRRITDCYGLTTDSVFSIHNAITNVHVVSPLKDCRLSIDFDLLEKKVILFAGKIVPIKGVEYLVKAANILVNFYHLNDIVFILAGLVERDKKYLKRMKHLIAQYNLTDYVKFIGHVEYETLGSIYSRCDIFVLPSLDEGFGLVVAEALSFGKPVVGTNVGGIPTQIVDGWNGFLVEPANSSQLAEKLKYLLTNETECLRMGKNGKFLVAQKFNWKATAVEYEKLYCSMNKF